MTGVCVCKREREFIYPTKVTLRSCVVLYIYIPKHCTTLDRELYVNIFYIFGERKREREREEKVDRVRRHLKVTNTCA